MDNYLSYIIEKTPATNEISKDELGNTKITLFIKKGKNSLENLKNISEIFKYASEIFNYVKMKSNAILTYSIDEITIIY